jgi:hypothetical protein
VALDEPGAVVAVDEASHDLAQLIGGVVQGGPQALVLQGANPTLRAAIGLRRPRNAGLSAIPSQANEPTEWAERYWGPQSWRSSRPRATSGPSWPPAVNDGVIDWLEGSEAVADLGHVRPGLGGVVVDAGEYPGPG